MKLAAILLPLYFFLLVSGREFIAVLFTQQYLESWPIFAIYLTLIPSLFLATAYDPILRAHPEHFGFLFRVRAALIPLLVSGLIWATGRFQLIGAISVVVTVSALERLIVGFKVARILGLSAKDWVLFRDVGRILCAAMIGAVGALWCRYLIGGASPLVLLLGSAVAFLAAYGLAVAWFKILAPEELHVIERHLARMGLSRPTR